MYAVAKICHCYGWTWDYAKSLPTDLLWTFYDCIDVINAEHEARQIDVANVAFSADNKTRKKITKSIEKRMLSPRETRLKTLTPEELAYMDAVESLKDGK